MTREEAIKILSERYSSALFSERTALETLVPELKESEEEKARKWIYDYIRNCPNESFEFYGGIGKKAVLAWLEKQKYDRMKPIYDARESFESALEKAWNDYHNGYENVDKLEDDYVECAHAKGFREGYLFGIEKQKEASKAIDVVERIDKFINEHLANAHDMKDSNPDKKYYRGWDDALGEMAGILQDVYSEEKQKEQKDFQAKVEQRMEYLWDKLPDAHRVEEGNCTPEEWKTLGAYMELEMNFDKGSEEKQKATETPQWMIDFLNDIRTASINKEGYDDYDGRREYEGKILAIIKYLEGNYIQQKPLTWKDLQKLDIIANKLWQDGKYDKNDAQEFYTEVLNEFNNRQEQKNKY